MRGFESKRELLKKIQPALYLYLFRLGHLKKMCNFLNIKLEELANSHNGVSIKRDILELYASQMKNLYKPTINGIIDCIRIVPGRKEASQVSIIVVVGGFAECSLLQDEIRENFNNKGLSFQKTQHWPS